ncbi:hypothetical protein N7478_004243 [Penicillium angulare]|uniref:uncharacterized protein n=1 Tax=Penicillium angulare TaxID=116970 RepID=UPI00254218BD|nr:uncharacterized protein N7478_004243 [Penicillium angulare]KAJ5278871.1 hypothetical protein N7478_004243 [Penicillium angulare]
MITMLSDLPSEIVVHITIYLPTISGVTNLAQTCQRLYKIINTEESSIFRSFVQNKFPCIETPPLWKDAARALTSRSRALDKLGIIGRFVIPPQANATTRIGFQEPTRRDNPTLGYRPAIDSYEVWHGERWTDRREVLAWGAGHQIVLRSKQSGIQSKEQWVSFNDVEEATSFDDVCGLHLLRDEKWRQDSGVEHLVFGRLRGELAHVELSLDTATHEHKQRFNTNGLSLEQTDLSGDTLAAHFDNGSVALYTLNSDESEIEPFAWAGSELDPLIKSRYSKLLSPLKLAIATGRLENSLSINIISNDGACIYREIGVDSLDLEDQVGRSVNAAVTAIAPLNTISCNGSPGDVFLAAWGDRTIRLHDLRSPHSNESTYRDTTDTNLIYSVQPFGHDRFLAGAGGNAVLKIFDLRMSKIYSYLDAQVPPIQTQTSISPKRAERPAPHGPRKDFSLFLSAQLPSATPGNLRARRRGPYRGPIYTMSTPSPSSPTVYTGIVDGVVRLDFASTDDLTGPSREWFDYDLNIEKGGQSVPVGTENVLRIAGYERPDQDDFTTTSKLRRQHECWYLEDRHATNVAEPGWDRRWEALEQSGAWRRRDG